MLLLLLDLFCLLPWLNFELTPTRVVGDATARPISLDGEPAGQPRSSKFEAGRRARAPPNANDPPGLSPHHNDGPRPVPPPLPPPLDTLIRRYATSLTRVCLYLDASYLDLHPYLSPPWLLWKTSTTRATKKPFPRKNLKAFELSA